MNTKETAIEFIKSFKETVTSIDIENGNAKAIEEYNDKIDEVIKLLQRGEKFEKMWGELEVYIEGKSEALTNKMNKLWQKYIITKGGSQ